MFKEMNLRNDSETRIKSLKCGRKAMQELRAHCNGTSKGARRKKVIRSDLKEIFYNNETTFTFEKYITKLKDIFNMLEKYGVPLYEEQMVNNLPGQIVSPNT